ncbi:MAG: hypothetical protein Kow0059_22230 [Candidatus Sumerlaeia bacterium]
MLLTQAAVLAGQTAGGGNAGGAGGGQFLLLLVGIMALFYFIVLRPQRREQKERQQLIDSLKVNDRVITIGGIHGTVKEIKDSKKTILIQVDKNTRLEINRSAVMTVLSKDKEEDEGAAAKS